MAEPRVLVTRPADQSETLGARLAQAGFSPEFAPLMNIEPFDVLEPDQRALLQDLDLFQHVIFVSRNAIRHGMDWIENFWPQLPVGICWYTVGSSSAAALAAFGVEVLQPESDMTSEGLLQRPELLAANGERVLIVKGEGGRRHLRETLEERGARVSELVVYRRGVPGYASGELAATIERCNIVLVSSGEGLDNMVSLLGHAALDVARARTLVVPGERVAELARDKGFRRIIVASNATDDAMLAALASQYGEQGG